MGKRLGENEEESLQTAQLSMQQTPIQVIEKIDTIRNNDVIQPIKAFERLELVLTLTVGGFCLVSFIYWLILIFGTTI